MYKLFAGAVGYQDVTKTFAAGTNKFGLGNVYRTNPMDVLKATTCVAGLGLKEWADARTRNDLFGCWDVAYVMAGMTLSAGTLVTQLTASVTATGGTTTTLTCSALSTPHDVADLYIDGMIIKDTDIGATTAEEGKIGMITDSSSTGFTWTPAFGEDAANTDVYVVTYPFKVVTAGAAQTPMGIALSAATVGQGCFILMRGLYLRAVVATNNAIVNGARLTTGASGAFAEAAAYTDPLAGYLFGSRSAASTGTLWPVWVNCLK